MILRYCFLSFMLLGLTTASANELRMAVSDLLAEYINPVLENYAEENEIKLKIDSIGSLPALDRLRSDEIDLAVIAVPAGDEVPREEFAIYPFAYDAAVVAVNANNPLDEISVPKLGGIYGSNEEFNYSTWGELGLSGWGNRNIRPLAGPAKGSISLELFRYAVFSGNVMKPSVTTVRDTEIEQALGGNLAAIGIMSSLPTKKNVKVLMLSTSNESPAYGPSAENIHYGDYPIRLPFYVAYNSRDEAKVKPILRALFGEKVAEQLNKNNLFALPNAVRNQYLVDLNFETK